MNNFCIENAILIRPRCKRGRGWSTSGNSPAQHLAKSCYIYGIKPIDMKTKLLFSFQKFGFHTASKRRTCLLSIALIGLSFSINNVKGQESDWVSLPQEVNSIVSCLVVYNDELIAGGHFTQAGDVEVNKIAAWNGSEWSPLGSGLTDGGVVTELIVFDGDLYAAGGFTHAGETEVNNIARWDGTEWTALGTGTDYTVHSMAVYNNELIIGGTFSSVGGQPASRIARWDGNSWHSLGSGIDGNNVTDLYVFQNELYAVGPFDAAGNTPSNNIARWNGTEWNNVSVGVGMGSTTMIEWDDQLLVGAEFNFDMGVITYAVNQWNGENWSVFSNETMFPPRKFLVFNDKLYCSGGVGAEAAPGVSQVAEWSGFTWNTVGTGINNYTPTLCEYNGELYCGGVFSISENAYHNYIARLSNSVSVFEKQAVENVRVYPNPFHQHFDIQIDKYTAGQNLLFSVFDVSGKLLYSSPILAPLTTVTDFHSSGLCFWHLTNDGETIQTGKLIGLN